MSRRGVALLVVLAVLVVAITATAGAARLSIASRAHVVVRADADLAAAIMVGAEGAIQRFLGVQSTRVVLPPDAPGPLVLVLDDRFGVDGRAACISITAYDQCGMVPWGAARRGSPLRSAMEEPILRSWDAHPQEHGHAGLDTLVASARAEGARAFPDPARVAGRSLGDSLATHNPDPDELGGPLPPAGGLININTAPRSLLAAALRAAGSSGLDEILRARARGEQAPIPASQAETGRRSRDGPGGPASATAIRLVGESDAWAFRVDVEVGSVRRSWWCVYRAAGSEWRCVQRVAITD